MYKMSISEYIDLHSLSKDELIDIIGNLRKEKEEYEESSKLNSSEKPINFEIKYYKLKEKYDMIKNLFFSNLKELQELSDKLWYINNMID